MDEKTPSAQNGCRALRKYQKAHPDRPGPSCGAVNSELVLLYWGIGKEILSRQHEEGWGNSNAHFPRRNPISRSNFSKTRTTLTS